MSVWSRCCISPFCLLIAQYFFKCSTLEVAPRSMPKQKIITCTTTATEVHSLSKFSNKGALSCNLSPPRLITTMRSWRCVARARGACSPSAQPHRSSTCVCGQTHTHSLIFTGPTAPLHLKVSGRDLYGKLGPPYNCECVCVNVHVHDFFELWAPRSLRVYLAAAAPPDLPVCCVCVSMRSVFMCVFAGTSLSGVNWADSPKSGFGQGPSSLSSGSRRSLSASLINSMSSG